MWNVGLNIFYSEQSALKMDSRRRVHFYFLLSYCLISAGVAIQTQKPQPSPTVVSPITLSTTNDNNFKKFAFLSQETVPDYRPRDNVSFSLTMVVISSLVFTAMNQITVWMLFYMGVRFDLLWRPSGHGVLVLVINTATLKCNDLKTVKIKWVSCHHCFPNISLCKPL